MSKRKAGKIEMDDTRFKGLSARISEVSKWFSNDVLRLEKRIGRLEQSLEERMDRRFGFLEERIDRSRFKR
jgi:hypothetical protein